MTWAGRGLGDVRGLCVAMCVGFGAAPAQPKGAGERRRLAQGAAPARGEDAAGAAGGKGRAASGEPDGGAVGSGELTKLVELPRAQRPESGVRMRGSRVGSGPRGARGGCPTADPASMTLGSGHRQGKGAALDRSRRDPGDPDARHSPHPPPGASLHSSGMPRASVGAQRPGDPGSAPHPPADPSPFWPRAGGGGAALGVLG